MRKLVKSKNRISSDATIKKSLRQKKAGGISLWFGIRLQLAYIIGLPGLRCR